MRGNFCQLQHSSPFSGTYIQTSLIDMNILQTLQKNRNSKVTIAIVLKKLENMKSWLQIIYLYLVH